jgi:hypothetical protein
MITEQVGHFWKADPGQFSKAPKKTVSSSSERRQISAELHVRYRFNMLIERYQHGVSLDRQPHR